MPPHGTQTCGIRVALSKVRPKSLDNPILFFCWGNPIFYSLAEASRILGRDEYVVTQTNKYAVTRGEKMGPLPKESIGYRMISDIYRLPPCRRAPDINYFKLIL
jgi:hypothetical protein